LQDLGVCKDLLGHVDLKDQEDHKEFQAISEHRVLEVLEDFKALLLKLTAEAHRLCTQQVIYN
jgi:hypothetical protein